MIEVSLEDDQVALTEVLEQVRRFIVDAPECVTGAPERVLLVHPLSLLFILLKGEFSGEQKSRIIVPSSGDRGA